MYLKAFRQKERTPKLFANTAGSTGLKQVNTIKICLKFSIKGVSMDTIIYMTFILCGLFL